MRCDAARETLWTQTSAHLNATSCDFLLPFDDTFLAIGDYLEPIDSSSWSVIQTVKMLTSGGEFPLGR